MVNVPAHTNQVGYYVQTFKQKSRRRPNGIIQSTGQPYDWSDWAYSDVPMAYSYKSPLIKSDGKLPTNYARKIARMKGGSYQASDYSGQMEGDSCYFLRIGTVPHGSALYSPGVPIPSWMTNKVIQDCMIDIMNLRANIGEDFGQAKQTVQMIANIFATIVKFFNFARKGQWRRLRGALRGMGRDPGRKVANGWLMYYYGIRPLVSTIDALCAAGGPKLKSKTVRRKVSSSVDPSPFAGAPGAKVSGKAEQRVLCVMTAYLNQDDSLAYWSSLGLTQNLLDDAIVTAWALVPYSFVLDWILPVERFLRTRRFSAGVTALHSSVSKSLVCDVRIEVPWIAGLASWNPGGRLPSANVRQLHFQREVYYGAVPPSGLSLNMSLTPTNLISAAALLIQRR